MRNILFLLVLFIFCQPAFTQNELIPVAVIKTSSFSEAPVFDQLGNLYISEPYRGPITKITPEGDTSTWANTAGANGHRILPDGSHLVCDQIARVVLKFDADGNLLDTVASTCGEIPLRHPNDLTLDAKGGFYFTDPLDRQKEEYLGRVCYVDPEGNSHLVDEYEDFTNGIAITEDGQTLYVASSFQNVIRAYPILSPGKVGSHEIFAKLPVQEDGKWSGPDGILLDPEGKLYVAQYNAGKIYELNPKGHLIRMISAGQSLCSNIALGGKDGKTLYVTGAPGELGGVLYKINLK